MGIKIRYVVAVSAVFAAMGSAHADLIAHYTFDSVDGVTTPCAVSDNFATLGPRVLINTTGGLAKVGSGVLEMLGPGDPAVPTRPIPGAATSNAFSLGTGARTLTFWWRALSPNVDVSNGTYLSMGGSGTVAGARLDVREDGASASSLRVEIQGASSNSNPPIDDGHWHFIVVVVPQGAQLKDVAWYVDGSTTHLNGATSPATLNTAASPLVMGASILTAQSARTPYGYLDDVQLYDQALSMAEIQSLYANPGSTIGGTLPAVEAGGNWMTWTGQPVTADAAVVNNTVNPVLPLTCQWSVDAVSLADSNLDILLTNADQEDVTVDIAKRAPTGEATAVTLTLTVNNEGSGNPDVQDTMTIEVYDDACQAALAAGTTAIAPTDFNGDCMTNLEDLAELLAVWLEPYLLAEPFVK